MKFIPEILVICFFFSLYSIFVYAKDNFVLLRKNITLEQLFNIAFIDFLFSILCARIVYIIENPSTRYFNPLVFLLFPYFPGLSYAGGIMGCLGFLWYITKKKKFPLWNIFDIFAISLFLSVSTGMLLVWLVNEVTLRKNTFTILFSSIASFIILTMVSIIHSKNKLKEGSVGFIITGIITFLQFILRMFSRTHKMFFSFAPEDILLGLLTIILLALYIKNEAISDIQKTNRRSSSDG